MIECKNCKRRVRVHKTCEWFCYRTHRIPQYHYSISIIDDQIELCSIRNENNDCKIFKPKIIYKIKQFFRRIFGL